MGVGNAAIRRVFVVRRYFSKEHTKDLARHSRNQMKSRVNHERHEAHEGYDLGAGLKPASKKIIFLSFNFVRFALFVVRSNLFYKIASVPVVIQKICASRENSPA